MECSNERCRDVRTRQTRRDGERPLLLGDLNPSVFPLHAFSATAEIARDRTPLAVM